MDYDVIIVGGRVAGSALAALLGEVDREVQAQRVRAEQRGQMTAQQRRAVQDAAAAALGVLDRKLKDYRERYEQDLKASRGLLTERFKRGTDLGRQRIDTCELDSALGVSAANA